MRKITLFLISALLFTITGFAQLSGPKSIPGDYATIALAIADLNAVGVAPPGVTFTIASGYTETFASPTDGLITATGTTPNDQIIFQGTTGGTKPLITAATGAGATDAIIKIAGGNYITFDGIDFVENSANTTATMQMEYGFFISNASAIDGAQNNTIKNCKIVLNRANTATRGIYQNVATTPTNATGANSNNKYQLIVIENSYNGIYLNGNATYPDLATEVSNCTVGASTPNDIGNGSGAVSALRLTSNQDVMVFNNTVRNVNVNGASNVYGIFLENVKGSNNQVYNNRVYNISSTSTSTSAILYGMRVDIPATFQAGVYNNLIYNFSHAIATPSATLVCRALAVNVSGTGNVALSYNTVNLNLNLNASCTDAYLGTGTIFLANNIFANYSNFGTTSKRYCIYRNGAAVLTSNYNDFYINSGTNNFVGYYTTDQATLANWQTTSAQDANSVNVNPLFVSTTDLHPSNPALDNLGTSTPVTVDIDGISRNVTTPDMGAYEFTGATCPQPSLLSATSVTNNSATLGWTSNGTETLWNIEWGTTGFVQGAGTTVAGLTANTYNLTGLIGTTGYSFYVQADCGGSTSIWAGPFSFITLCDPLSIPYNEGFESITANNQLPSCMAATSLGSLNLTYIAATTYNRTPHSGNNFASFRYAPAGNWFFFAPIQLTAGVSYDASTWYITDGATGFDALNIAYGTSQSGASMTTITTATTPVNTTYQQLKGTFVPATTGVYYIGIQVTGTSTSPWYLTIDDILVDLTPNCVQPTTLTATSVSPTSATLGWTAGGTETLWNIEWGTTGFVQGTGTTVSGLTANTYNLTGLTANTNYSFYVQADCGGSTSTWAGPFSFFTGYCTPAPSSVDGSGITNVTFGTINNTTGAEVGNYGDYSAMVNDVAQTTTATVNITYSTGYTYDTKIWVDWNDNLDFLDAGDEVYVGTSLSANPTTLVATFIVPLTATLGNHRMRIGGLDVGPATPCYNGSYGTFEDYTINVTAAPSCPAPSVLTATAVTNNAATLGWTAGGTEALWNIEWGTTGFVQGTGTTVAGLTANNYNLTGLTATTGYSFYVQADCGGSTSTWAGPFSFTTLCDPISSFPWVENFGATLPSCWTNTPSADNDMWLFGIPGGGGGTDPAGYGATSDHTSGSGYVAWVNDSETPIANPDVLTTPVFNLTSMTNPELRFWYWIGNATANSSSLQVDVYNGTLWTNNVATVTSNGMWQEVIVNLNAYKSANTQIRFVGTEYYTVYSYQSDITLDDVSIQEAPACPATTALSATSITNNAATLGWTAGGTETLWNIEWGTFGFVQGTGTTVAGLTANSYNLTGLTSATPYSFYVQADCGGSTSIWTGPYTFNTLCDNVNTFPFAESFDGTTYAPICWTNIKTGGSGAGLWDRQTAGTYPTCAPNSGAAMSRFNCFNYSSGTTGLLVTPALDLPSDLYEVRFWMYRDDGYATSTDLVNVYYNTTSDTIGATLLGTINRSNTLAPAEATANQWYEYHFNMPAGSTGTGRYVILEGVSDYGNNIFVDDVQVKAQVSTASDILTFDVPSQVSSTVGVGTVNITMCGANVTALVPTITVSAGATISPASGLAQDFTNPVTYTVTAEDGITTSTWTVTVVSNPLPTVTLTSSATVTICQGDTTNIDLAFTGTAPWNWVGDDGTGPVIFNALTSPQTLPVAPAITTTYSIISVTDANGCSNTSTDAVIVTVNASPLVSLGADVTLCSGSSAILDAGNAGSTFLWSDGSTAQTLTVNVTGTYSVTVTNSSSCSAIDSIVITFSTPGVVTITDVAGTLTSDATSGNQWYDGNGQIAGEVNQTYTPTVDGNYYVIVTDINGCTSTSNILSIIVSTNIVNANSAISVYPNPANDKVWINVVNKNASQTKVEIRTLDGRLLFENESNSTGNTRISVDLKEFASGIYIVKAVSGENTSIQKLIVK